jgi:hypothetical protein
VNKAALRQVLLRVFQFSSVSIILSMLHILRPLLVARIARTNGRNLEVFQKSALFKKARSIAHESNSAIFPH